MDVPSLKKECLAYRKLAWHEEKSSRDLLKCHAVFDWAGLDADEPNLAVNAQ